MKALVLALVLVGCGPATTAIVPCDASVDAGPVRSIRGVVQHATASGTVTLDMAALNCQPPSNGVTRCTSDGIEFSFSSPAAPAAWEVGSVQRLGTGLTSVGASARIDGTISDPTLIGNQGDLTIERLPDGVRPAGRVNGRICDHRGGGYATGELVFVDVPIAF